MRTLHSQCYRQLATRLREARVGSGLTQKDAAAALGRPQSYVSKVESCERRIDAIELKRLAELYGRRVGDLLEGL